MARTTKQIYDSMVSEKERRVELAGLTSTSVTAVWRMLLWVVASGIQMAETLADKMQEDIEMELAEKTPHRPRWYAEKAKQYMQGMTLIEGSDEYDLSGLSDTEISSKRVVKYAAAIESYDMSRLYVKVAGEDEAGVRRPLSTVTAIGLRAYMNEIKDAGVRIELVNQAADRYSCVVKVLYDPMLAPEDVESRVKEAIEHYIAELPFAGEYSNMALIDAVQVVEGVKIAELQTAQVREANQELWQGVSLRYTPAAGYMQAEDIRVELDPYSLYEGV